MVKDNTYNCGFCMKGVSHKELVGINKYKQTSNRPCSECILPRILHKEKDD